MALQFVDRNGELEALGTLLKGKRASLVLLYGRRRVGKTRLIQEFMKGRKRYLLLRSQRGEGDDPNRVLSRC